MTVRVIVDASPLIRIHVILLQLNSHVQKITGLSTAICSVSIIVAAKTLLLFYL